MQSIGRYRVDHKIGSGTQGDVYLCTDPKLKREVAIKLLHSTAFNKSTAQLIEQEAQALSLFQHQNIVSIYDIGESAGQSFIVFEYVKGQLLDEWLTDKAHRLENKLKIMSGIIKAVALAHQAGVIHRDIKPQNIIIDSEGTPKLMDFGISMLLGDDASSQDILGTAGYMAPEYIRKNIVTPRLDVFALGAVCYQVLTGMPAFSGRSANEIHQKVLRGEVEAPSELSSAVSKQLDEFCLKSLAVDPSDRYEDATDMLLDLQICIASATEEQGLNSHGKATLEFIYRRMQRRHDFPALADSIRSINELQATSQKDAERLASVIVNDFSLTNKILKVVNSAYYGGFSGKINTVSRAIVVLGVESVRSIAASLIFFEHMSNKGLAVKMKKMMASSMFRALLAEQITRHTSNSGVEETFLCAMFLQLGQTLVSYYLPEEDQEIARGIKRGEYTEKEIVRQVLGVSYEEVGAYVAAEWNFPDMIIDVIRTPDPQSNKKPTTDEERFRLTTHFAEKYQSRLIAGDDDESIIESFSSYQKSLGIAPEKIQASLKVTRKQFADVAQSLFTQSNMRTMLSSLQGELPEAVAQQMKASESMELDQILAAQTTQKLDAETILTNGLQEVSNIMLTSGSVSQVFITVLESLYRAMEFRQVFLCLQKANVFYARLGFGGNIKTQLKEFSYILDNEKNVFTLSLKKGVDIYIADVNAKKIRKDIPNWFNRFTDAGSFVLFPLMLNNRPVGFIYGEFSQPEQLKLKPEIFNLIKSLRNQMILALKSQDKRT